MFDDLFSCFGFCWLLLTFILVLRAIERAGQANKFAKELAEEVDLLRRQVNRLAKPDLPPTLERNRPEAASPAAESTAPATVPTAQSAGASDDLTSAAAQLQQAMPVSPAPAPTPPLSQQRQPARTYAAALSSTPRPPQSLASHPVEQPSVTPPAPTPTAPHPLNVALDALRERVQSLTGEQILVRAMVLVGGLALAMAGIYFAKYSYDQGLLPPGVRLSLGAGFGLILIGLGAWLHTRSARVAQSAVAAGVAVLFAIILAGHHVEHLFPPLTTFALLASATALAVALSLRHGAFVALLGLLGGFATPALIGSSEHNTGSLFGYLLILQLGLLVVIRRRGWWWLSLLMLLGGQGWGVFWLLFNFQTGDSAWLGFYLLVLGAMSIWTAGDGQALPTASTPADRSDPDAAGDDLQQVMGQVGANLKSRAAVGWLGGLACIALAALLVPKGGYGWVEWGYFGLLGVGALTIARARPLRWPLVVVAAVVTLALLTMWIGHDLTAEQEPLALVVLGGAFVIYGLGSYGCAFGSVLKPRWGWLSVSASVLVMLLLYAHNHAAWSKWTWAALSLGLAAAHAGMATPWLRRRAVDRQAEAVLAAMVTGCCFYLAVAMPIAFERQWLALGWSVLVLLLALADRWLNIRTLRIILTLVAWGTMALLLLGLPVLAPPLGTRVIFNWLLYGYGLPMLAFAGVAWTLRRSSQRQLAELFDLFSGLCLLVLVTLEVRHGFHREQWLTQLLPLHNLWELGTYPTLWLLVSAGLLAYAGKLQAPQLRVVALLIGGLAAGVLLGGLGVVLNPLWGQFEVVGRRGLTMLLYSYGTPGVLLIALAWWLHRRGENIIAAGAGVVGTLTLLLLLNLEIRHGFRGRMHADDLLQAGNLWEWGTYAVVWLLGCAGLGWAQQRWQMRTLGQLAQFLGTVAVAYILLGLCVILNPLWGHLPAGEQRLVNVLLYAYGLPTVMLLGLGFRLRQLQVRTPAALLTGTGLLVLFVLVNLQVRQWFHGANLDIEQAMSNAERYAYSAAWVVLATLLLVAGIATRSLLVRWASLLIMLLTIGKTFLDTRNLQDLYRVASFLGLGIALLAVGLLYHRFVFRRDAQMPGEREI